MGGNRSAFNPFRVFVHLEPRGAATPMKADKGCCMWLHDGRLDGRRKAANAT